MTLFIGILLIITFVVCGVVCLKHKKKVHDGFLKNRRGDLIYWSKSSFPVNILINQSISKKYLKTCREIVTLLNKKVGDILFDPTYCYSEKEVVKASGVPKNSIYITPKKGKYDLSNYRYDPKTGALKSSFITVNTGIEDSNLAYTVLAHGIFHGLGLAHSRDRQSIMYPLRDSLYEKAITKREINLLKKKYT
jgi:hypothetical protein